MAILCVGVACLDIVQVCDAYPLEDSKTRGTELRWRRGGNASNSCTVLSLLGAKSEFLGTIGTKNASFMVDDFKTHGISLEHCVIHENHQPITATLIISTDTGSRTAVYCPGDLPELSIDDFRRLDLSHYSWIHFEGRNTGPLAEMMKHAVLWKSSHEYASLQISVELEIPIYSELLAMSVMADCVFVGKDFALSNGWGDMHVTLDAMTKYAKPGATVIVPWGEHGAAGRGPDGTVATSPSFPPPRVVDTIAAGDTFIAATIFALSSGQSTHDSITFGCRIAGAKVGMSGFSRIAQAYSELCGQGR